MTVLPATTQPKLFFDAIWRVCRWRTRASSGPSAEPLGGWRKALGLISGVEVLAFADQAVVSATSFFTMVMVGRYSNPAELGAYAIGISVLAVMYTVQGSLISHPYSIQRFRILGTPAQHAGSTLAHSGLLSAMATIVLAVTGLGLYAFGAGSQLFAMTLVLAGVAPFTLLREFGRAFSFTHLQIAQSLILDVAVAAMQISMLAWLGWTGRMSAITAFGALGASCGAVAIGWLCFARAEFVIELGQVRATMKLSWGLGKWLTLGQVAGQLRRFSTYWLSVMIAGTAVTGVYAACMSIVSFANPVMFGLGNILTPKAVLAWKEGGAAGLRRQIVRDALLLGLVMASFCVVVLFAGEDVMRFLYHGKEYEGQAHIVSTLAFATLMAAIGLPAGCALAAMERPRATVGVGAVASIVTVVLVWWLMREWGLAGAAYGLLAGNAVASAGLWLAFLVLVRRACDLGSAIRVLKMLPQTSGCEEWAIARLGEGDHAIVYAIQSKDGKPLWRSYSNLAIKVYKPDAGLSLGMVNAQFTSAVRLHAALDGRIVNGWKISIPKPLYISTSPMALVMTAVSGKSLNSSAVADDDLTPDVLNAIGHALIAAMQKSWSRGELHGDLALRNILCDIRGKNLSFIDPGTQESCSICSEAAKLWRPPVLDLGHVLRDPGVGIREMIGYPIARLRRQIFAESVVRSFLETIGPFDEKQRLLHEVRACAQSHLWKFLKLSWSPRGLADWLVGQVVFRRMETIFDRLRDELGTCDRTLEHQPHLLLCDRQRVEA
jgi:O-antigen/teichoic acid export membrane protein